MLVLEAGEMMQRNNVRVSACGRFKDKERAIATGRRREAATVYDMTYCMYVMIIVLFLTDIFQALTDLHISIYIFKPKRKDVILHTSPRLKMFYYQQSHGNS